jgi:AGZA family xanthine/uracil permease-like MFS transporter
MLSYCYSPMLKKLESYFEFARLGTSWRTEILAGVTTFLTMAYIVLVNPAILAAAGMPLAAVTAATCLSAGFASILMGIVARYPIALAPGMGLNAYFAYAVCIKLHVPWQTALGAVFLSGILFLAFTAAGIRQMILRAIPHELYAAVASGIGLFIALIGFRNAGLVVADANTCSTWAASATPPPCWPSSACSSWWLWKPEKSAAPSSSASSPSPPSPGCWA